MGFAKLAAFLFPMALSIPLARAEDALSPEAQAAYPELKRLLTPYVRELTRPVTVYNWYHAENGEEFRTDSKDPQSYQSFLKQLDKYGQPDGQTNHVASPGIYVAVDPLVSRSYGGFDGKWVLTQIQLPKKFRIVDSLHDHLKTLPPGDKDLFAKIGCPKPEDEDNFLDLFTAWSEFRNAPGCSAILKKLVADLGIDGFMYSFYVSAPLKDCDGKNMNRNAALVLTHADKITPDAVKFFTKSTKGEEADRRRIQSFFSKSLQDAPADDFPGGGDQVDTSRLTPSPKADPETLSESKVHSNYFMWNDLEGKPFDKGLGSWVRENHYGCANEAPTVKARAAADPGEQTEDDPKAGDDERTVAPAQ